MIRRNSLQKMLLQKHIMGVKVLSGTVDLQLR